jgi:hypothetical protein
VIVVVLNIFGVEFGLLTSKDVCVSTCSVYILAGPYGKSIPGVLLNNFLFKRQGIMSSDKFPSTSEGDSSNQKKRKKEEEFTIEVSNRFERLSEDEMEENYPEENPNINVSSKKYLLQNS